jgi:sugar lactone lactonase YvrE
VANLATNSLTEYPASANGDVAPLATIAGASTGLKGPQGLAIDGSGNVLTANTYGNSLTAYKVTDNGNVAPQRTIAGSVTGLNAPHGIGVDAQGNIHVANELGGTSYWFAPRGHLTTFAANASGNAFPQADLVHFVLSSPTGLAVTG